MRSKLEELEAGDENNNGVRRPSLRLVVDFGFGGKSLGREIILLMEKQKEKRSKKRKHRRQESFVSLLILLQKRFFSKFQRKTKKDWKL